MSRLAVAVIAATTLLSGVALAQQPATYKVRLAADSRNVGLCNEMDTALGREHTLSVTATGATVTGAGGVKATMKMISPNIYQNANMQLGANQFLVVADTAKKTLVLTDNRLGCRWSGNLS